MSKYNVYGLGAGLVDTEIEVTDQFLAEANIEKGQMTLVDEARQHELLNLLDGHMVGSKRASGGSAANSIIAVSAMGGSSYYSCKVANDENGDFYHNDLKTAGVDACFDKSREVGITGKCLVMITPDAERTMNTFLGISETLCEKNLNEEALSQSEWFYMEGYLVTSDSGRAAAVKAREIAEQNNVKTSISLSDPGMVEFFKPGLKEMIGTQVDLAFCNKEEALGWAETESLDEAIEALKQIAKTFVITLGSEGALVFDGETSHQIEPHSVKAIDTNGAGDAFAGAFLYGLTNGLCYKKSGELASLTSATVVTQYGPRLANDAYKNLLEQFKA